MCSNIRGEIILGSRRFIIGVVSLEKFLDLLDFFISGIEEIFVRCRCFDKVNMSSALNILLDVFHLEVHCLWV